MRSPEPLPKISQPLLRFFGRYADGYLRRHFHSVRLLAEVPPPRVESEAVVVFSNHASWWDPLLLLFVARTYFPGYSAYGPIAASALARYGFFKRLGFFPVEIGTRRGAAQFLRTSEAVLAQPRSALFLTPQGRFADVRAPLEFAPGIEHLAARVPQARFLPLALEYTFWEERKPEVLIAFGPDGLDQFAPTQARLAAAAQRREPNEWEILVRGRSGVGWSYDLWRSLRARLRGERFVREHSEL
ncbi:MAG: lysophospholipid acyltransferase family protein [Chthoniobacterales bacterium]